MTHRWIGTSLLTVVATFSIASAALAQEGGYLEPTPTGSEGSGGGSTASNDRLRSAPWVAGGFNFLAGESTVLFGLRAEGGFALPVDGLSIVGSFNFAGRNGFQLIGIAAGISYEYIFDKDFPGALGFIGQADLGFGLLFGGPDTLGAALIRFTATARYYLDAVPGFFVSLQPVGFSIYARNNAGTFYDFLTGVGFRFGV
jgi:hypothetical protein